MGVQGTDSSSDYIVGTGHELKTFTHLVVHTPNDIATDSIVSMKEDAAGPSGTIDRVIGITTQSTYGAYLWDGSNRNAETTTLAVAGVTRTIAQVVENSAQMDIWLDGVKEGTTVINTPFTGYTTPEIVFFRGGVNGIGSGGGVSDDLPGDGHTSLFLGWGRNLSEYEAEFATRFPYRMFDDLVVHPAIINASARTVQKIYPL